MRYTTPWFSGVLLLLLGFCCTNLSAAPQTEVFQASTAQLRTPGVGFQEFVDRMPSDADLSSCSYDPSLDGLDIKAGSVYVRMMWQEFEPADGVFAWDKLDQLFACAKAKGQAVDLRVMLTWPPHFEWLDNQQQVVFFGLPDWLLAQGVATHSSTVYSVDGSAYDLPDWNDVVIRQYHERLIRALGERYDGHPDLNSVDIGSVGVWGEWHIFGAQQYMPTVQQQKDVIDLYEEAFSNTPLVPLVGAYDEPEVETHLISKQRLAWRGDSWGVEGHHLYQYDALVNQIPDAWREGLVALEVSGVMSEWADRNDSADEWDRIFPIETVVADAIRWHASVVHNKANELPLDYLPALRDLAQQLGFRFVFHQAQYDDNVQAGGSAEVVLDVENVGIAPAYRDFRFALRLRDSNGDVRALTTTANGIKGWMPNTGIVEQALQYVIPNGFPEGAYNLEVGIVFYGASDRVVPIAVQEARADGWLRLGVVNIGAGVDTQIPVADVSVPVNGADRLNIIDGDTASRWENVTPEQAHFTLTLDGDYSLTQIHFMDEYDRELLITLDGETLFEGWTNGAGISSYAGILLDSPLTGSEVRFSTPGAWLTPYEVRLYGMSANGDNVRVYEDAEDGDTQGWAVYDNRPAGAIISNYYDAEKGSRVIQTEGARSQNGYRFGNFGGQPGEWNNRTQTVLSWDMNYDGWYIINVAVDTQSGPRLLKYTGIANSLGIQGATGQFIHHGLSESSRIGNWHSVHRDLALDLAEFEPQNAITAVNGFFIWGDGRLDNLIMRDQLPDAVYEDAEDGTINGWQVYETNPPGATITNVYDGDKASRVIQVSGSGTANGYRLGAGGTKWNNRSQPVLSWDMKYAESYDILVNVRTVLGQRNLKYTHEAADRGILGNAGVNIHHGLGQATRNGQWHTVSRNLDDDIKDFEPGNSLISVNNFTIRGSGRLDDIKLSTP